MTGAELKLLCYLNGVKTYDIANTLGYSHTTMTRLCQPSRVLDESVTIDILDAMKTLKGNSDIVTSVTIPDVAEILNSLN